MLMEEESNTNRWINEPANIERVWGTGNVSPMTAGESNHLLLLLLRQREDSKIEDYSISWSHFQQTTYKDQKTAKDRRIGKSSIAQLNGCFTPNKYLRREENTPSITMMAKMLGKGCPFTSTKWTSMNPEEIRKCRQFPWIIISVENGIRTRAHSCSRLHNRWISSIMLMIVLMNIPRRNTSKRRYRT